MNKFMAGLTIGIIFTTCFFIVYHPFQKKTNTDFIVADSTMIEAVAENKIVATPDTIVTTLPSPLTKSSSTINRDSLVAFAKSLTGIPYLYGSTDPAKGFDCSGFITFVFNHFKKEVPRSSYDFAGHGQKKTLSNCEKGDIILFSGTNPEERTIGHIGLVSENVNGIPSFLHSSSGKAMGVTTTSMENKFYQERFMSVIDLLSVE